MRILNPTANPTNRYLSINQNNLSKSLQRLSSGVRVNSAADDAAGLAVSETIRTQVRGLAQASANTEDGVNLLRTAEGGLQEMQNMLHRMRELVVQGANETYTDADRSMIQGEIAQLKSHLQLVAENTEFNGIKLLVKGTGQAGGAVGYVTMPLVSATIPGTAGTPTVLPMVSVAMQPTITYTTATVYAAIGVQTQPAGVTIGAGSLGGVAVDPNGNVYVAGSEPPGVLVTASHAIIRITPSGMSPTTTSFGATDTNWARTASNAIGAGIVYNPADNNVYLTANPASPSGFIQRISAGTAAGAAAAATNIHALAASGDAFSPRTFFGAGIAINPLTGGVTYGSASPAYDPLLDPFAGSPYPGSNTNNIWEITSINTRTPLLVQDGNPLPATPWILAPAASNADLHNHTGIPNNAHETSIPATLGNWSTELPAFSGSGLGPANFNGDNIFIQDYAFDTTGRIFFSSRRSAPLEIDVNGGLTIGAQLQADGKFYMSTPTATGVQIQEIDLSGAPPGGVLNPPVRFGGVVFDPTTGDVLVSDRDNSRVLRIQNVGTGSQTITEINTGGRAVVGMTRNPVTGEIFMTTQTANNEVLRLFGDIPFQPTIMTATINGTAGTATVAAVFGPAEFVALDGSLHIQTGANEAQDVRIAVNDLSLDSLNLEGMDINLWGSNPYGSVSTDQYVEDVSIDLRRIDAALEKISTVRATFGAYENRLNHARSNVDNAREQQATADSRIRDADMAKEASEQVRNQILTQASTGMLSQVHEINSSLIMNLFKNLGG